MHVIRPERGKLQLSISLAVIDPPEGCGEKTAVVAMVDAGGGQEQLLLQPQLSLERGLSTRHPEKLQQQQDIIIGPFRP